MIRQNEAEEIIRLIHNGFDLDLLSFELDISTEQLQEFTKRLKIREFAKRSITNGTISEAICKLESLIENNYSEQNETNKAYSINFIND